MVGAVEHGRGADRQVRRATIDDWHIRVEEHRLPDDPQLHRHRPVERHQVLLPHARPQHPRLEPGQYRRQSCAANPAERATVTGGDEGEQRPDQPAMAGAFLQWRGVHQQLPRAAGHHCRRAMDGHRRVGSARLHHSHIESRHPLLLPGRRPQPRWLGSVQPRRRRRGGRRAERATPGLGDGWRRDACVSWYVPGNLPGLVDLYQVERATSANGPWDIVASTSNAGV